MSTENRVKRGVNQGQVGLHLSVKGFSQGRNPTIWSLTRGLLTIIWRTH